MKTQIKIGKFFWPDFATDSTLVKVHVSKQYRKFLKRCLGMV
jgi:hypothetical protein